MNQQQTNRLNAFWQDVEAHKALNPFSPEKALVILKSVALDALLAAQDIEQIGVNMMQTIEFVPFEWDNPDFNPDIDRIEVDYQWHEADESVGLIAYCEKTVKWMRFNLQIKDITDELSYADLAYLKDVIKRNDQEIADERT